MCGICMDKVWDKPEAKRIFGILPNCTHAHCLGCLRTWRRNRQDFPPDVIKSVSWGGQQGGRELPRRLGLQGQPVSLDCPLTSQGLSPVPCAFQLHHPQQILGEQGG